MRSCRNTAIKYNTFTPHIITAQVLCGHDLFTRQAKEEELIQESVVKDDLSSTSDLASHHVVVYLENKLGLC